MIRAGCKPPGVSANGQGAMSSARRESVAKGDGVGLRVPGKVVEKKGGEM